MTYGPARDMLIVVDAPTQSISYMSVRDRDLFTLPTTCLSTDVLKAAPPKASGRRIGLYSCENLDLKLNFTAGAVLADLVAGQMVQQEHIFLAARNVAQVFRFAALVSCAFPFKPLWV